MAMPTAQLLVLEAIVLLDALTLSFFAILFLVLSKTNRRRMEFEK